MFNNNCSNNNNRGFYIRQATNNNILNNNCSDNWDGIYLDYYSIKNYIINNTCDSNSNYGIYIDRYSSWNNIFNNSCNYNSNYGIYLYRECKANNITNNYCISNIHDGINIYYYSQRNNITNNICNLNGDSGIMIYYYSYGNNLTNNSCNNNGYCGINVANYSPWTNITNNTCNSNNDHGIYIYDNCPNNTLSSNICNGNFGNGIRIESYSPINNITDNTCNSNSDFGIYLNSIDNNTLVNNNCTGNSNGILLTSSNNNTVINNICNSNTNYGIQVVSSNNSVFVDNNCLGNSYGIHLGYSNYTTIENNNWLSNFYGVYLLSSNHTTIENNNCSNNNNGIYLDDSNFNIMNNNALFSITNVGFYFDTSSNNTIKNNTCYANFAGMQIWAFSNDNTIEDNICPTGTVGVYMAQSSNNLFRNNNYGSHSVLNIYILSLSNNNQIINNICENSMYGIYLQSSSGNTIYKNNCQSITSYGIAIFSSTANIVNKNDLRNTNGLYLDGSGHNINYNIIETSNPNVHGITLSTNVNKCVFSNNNIKTTGDGAAGIMMPGNQDCELQNNIIETLGNRSFGISATNCVRVNYRYNNINVYGRETAGFLISNSDINISNSYVRTYGVYSPGVTIIASDVFIKDSTIMSDNNLSFNLSMSAYVVALNAKYNSVNILNNPLSILTIMNYLTISVNYTDLEPVPNMDVNVSSNNVSIYRTSGYGGKDRKTGADGKVKNIPVISHIYNQTLIPVYYTTNISVKKTIQSHHWNSTRNYINMSKSHTEYFTPTVDIAAPQIPKIVSVESFPDGHALTIRWEFVHDVVLYELYLNGTGDPMGSFYLIRSLSGNTSNSTDLLNLVDGTIYTFKVRARDGSGLWCGFSEPVGGMPRDTQPPATPTGFEVDQITVSNVNLSWNPNTEDDLEGYAIYRMYRQETKLLVKTTKTWYNDIQVLEGANYSYSISAYDEVPNYSPKTPGKIVNIPIIPLSIVSKTPAAGAVGVPIGTTLKVTFNKPMVKESVEGAFNISPAVEGTFTWSNDDKTLTFTPVENLPYITTYTITIGTEAIDKKFGLGLGTAAEWSFTTEPDLMPPEVLDHSPTGTKVLITSTIMIEFSEAMDKNSVSSALVLTPAINGTIIWQENTILYIPQSFLKYNTTYKVQLGSVAKDTAGNAIASAYVWEFTTLTVEKSPPIIIAYSPVGSDVPVDTGVSITFNKPMNTKQTQKAFSIEPSVKDGKFSWDGNTLVFNHSDFKTNTTYTVKISTLAADTYGNRLQESFIWEFTTSSIGIYRPPKIVSLTPAPGAIVNVNTKLQAKFSKGISYPPATLTLRDNNGVVINGTVEYLGYEYLLRFTLPAGKRLEYGIVYNLTISGIDLDIGAFELYVGDNTYSWEFTTRTESESDSDSDGMNDKWENSNGLNPFDKYDAAGDNDGDKLTNYEEFLNNTDPQDEDTDDDSLDDYIEVTKHHTNPTAKDSDGDDYPDAEELAAGTDPNDDTSHPTKKKDEKEEPNYAFLILAVIIIIIIVVIIILFMVFGRGKKPGVPPQTRRAGPREGSPRRRPPRPEPREPPKRPGDDDRGPEEEELEEEDEDREIDEAEDLEEDEFEEEG
ncbi:Ig-like domain-containing protein [[Eubacterium] cellulosolvens]